MCIKSIMTLIIPFVVMVTCFRIQGVQAYVSYVPTSSDSSDETYDVGNQQPEDVFDNMEDDDDDVLFKLLNRIISKNLHRSRQPYLDDGFDGSSNFQPNIYRPSKRVPANYMKQKRKVFWQPLGYLPPGVNIPGQQNSHATAGGSRSQVFRYGK